MFVSRRLPLLCLPYVFVSKIASFHSRLPFRHQWVRFQTHFLSENSVMDNRRKWKNPCELQHYMRAKNWLCCVMSTENVMSLSKSLRAVSLMEASTGRLRLSNYWNRSTLTPHPTDWPTQTSKDFHLGTCILMGGNWSPGQSIGIARLLFDRFSYLHIPLSYTTFRQQLTGYHTANIFQSLTWWTHCTAQDLLKKIFGKRERKTLHDMQNLLFLVDQCRIRGRFVY